MKIQHLDAEYAGKQDTYKIRALKPKKIPEERRKQGNRPRDGIFSPPVSDEEEEVDVEHPIPNEDNQMNKEPEIQELNPQFPMDSQPAKILDTMDTNGSKRHTSDNSDSDKDNPQPMAKTSLALVSSMPTQGEWRKVGKKKGRKACFFSPFVRYFLLSLNF